MNKKIKYGTFSVLSIIFFIVTLVCINLLANKFDLKFDLTKDKLYTICNETKKVINNLNEKIDIYFLANESDQNKIVANLVNQYKSKNIKVEYKDLDKYPNFANKYETDEKIPSGSIIVAGTKKFKVIKPEDIVTYDYDYLTFKQKIDSINVESEITNAINFVTKNYTPVIYRLIGHNELEFDYQKQFTNYKLQDLDLIIEQKIPDDCKILLITTPQRDWTTEEASLIDKYLASSSAIIFMDYTNKDLPNMTNVIKKYGFEFGNSIIIEKNNKNFAANNNAYLIPNFTSNELSQSIAEKKYRLLIPLCRNIFINDTEKIEVLLESSNVSYGKTNLNSTTIEKESGDLNGPLNIAIFRQDDKSKIIAVGATSILDTKINSYIDGGNFDFVMSAINKLNGKEEAIYIPPKTHDTQKIIFTHRQTMLISIMYLIILPAIIFFIGIIVIRNRHNK